MDLLFVLLVSFLASGCSQEPVGSTDSGMERGTNSGMDHGGRWVMDGAFDLGWRKAACAPAIPLTTRVGLTSAVNTLPWEDLHQLVSKPLAVSGDYRVTGSLVLDAADVVIPPSCDPYLGGCPRPLVIWIQDWADLPGVTCLQKTTNKYGGCHRLQIRDTTIRFRALVWDFHPSERLAVLQLLQACNAPCPRGQLRCAINNTCWRSFHSDFHHDNSYCRLCLGLSQRRCACSTIKGPRADGTKCQYYSNLDVVSGGGCAGEEAAGGEGLRGCGYLPA